jgi:outer membrane protein OmpA-like peptidoglycan-associated protein/tetratricopeptide (TPR) repeat protein
MSQRVFPVLCLIALLLPAGSRLYAQNSQADARAIVEIANDAYFNTRALIVANEQYILAAGMDPDNVEANYMAGRTCLETHLKSRAKPYLLRAYERQSNYRFNILYMIGQACQYGYEFEAAIDYYSQYLVKLQQNPRYSGADRTDGVEVERRIFECRNGLEYYSRPAGHRLENLGPEINSEWDDFAPAVNADESFMVFTTRRQDGNTNEDVFEDMLFYEDIFYTAKSGGRWQLAANIGAPVNTRYHDSNIALNAAGDELYLYNDQNGGDIFLSKRKPDGSWSAPEPLGSSINSTFSENSVAISPDGSMLIFSSDRPITEGKTDLDLYYATRENGGQWTRARSLGPVINTPYDEDGPFLDYDGKTLYFSSKGHKGMGGYDIYRSVYDSAAMTWSEPENLGFPVNTPDNDVYLVKTRDGKRAYYSSSRDDGFGFIDLYVVHFDDEPPAPLAEATPPADEKEPEKEPAEPQPEERSDLTEEVLPPAEQLVVAPPVVRGEPKRPAPAAPDETGPPTVVLLLKAVDRETQAAVDASLSVARLPENRPIRVIRLDQGLYRIEFRNTGTVQYRLAAEKAGYMFKNLSVEITGNAGETLEYRRKLSMDRLHVGFVAELRNIYFDFDKALIKSASYNELRRVKRMLDDNPSYRVEIAGHTDRIGSPEYNLSLSQRRAQAVVDYLVKQGVPSGRLIARGYGETQPIASNDDEREGRELNRRVEFRVLEQNR